MPKLPGANVLDSSILVRCSACLPLVPHRFHPRLHLAWTGHQKPLNCEAAAADARTGVSVLSRALNSAVTGLTQKMFGVMQPFRKCQAEPGRKPTPNPVESCGGPGAMVKVSGT